MGLSDIRASLERHGLRLSRELGQNFLVEDALAERLAQLAGVERGEAAIEIGTGLGSLTRALARRAEKVVTIEFDAGLVRALRADALLPANVELVHADALSLDLAELVRTLARSQPPAAVDAEEEAEGAEGAEGATGAAAEGAGTRPVHVVANLPYSAASPLLRRLLDLRGLVVDWSVMLQRELADRLVAEPGTREYGSLTVLHRLVVDVVRELDLKPGCFFPVPAVESSFVRMHPRAECAISPDELRRVERVTRALFNQRRKTILNGLRAAGLPWSGERELLLAALASIGVDPRERAEKLEPERLLALCRALESPGAAASG